MFELTKIRHDPLAKTPLAVDFTADGKSCVLNCNASVLGTFKSFRRAVANQFGIWLAGNYSGRTGRDCWEADVRDAFAAGTSKTAK